MAGDCADQGDPGQYEQALAPTEGNFGPAEALG
jgi:hypothetical protein